MGHGEDVGTLFCELGLVRSRVCCSFDKLEKRSSRQSKIMTHIAPEQTPLTYSMLIHEKVLNLCSVWDLWRRKSFMIVCSYCNVDLRPLPLSSYQMNIKDFPRLSKKHHAAMFSFSLSCSPQRATDDEVVSAPFSSDTMKRSLLSLASWFVYILLSLARVCLEFVFLFDWFVHFLCSSSPRKDIMNGCLWERQRGFTTHNSTLHQQKRFFCWKSRSLWHHVENQLNTNNKSVKTFRFLGGNSWRNSSGEWKVLVDLNLEIEGEFYEWWDELGGLVIWLSLKLVFRLFLGMFCRLL
jgi:hypothetical protein